MTAIRGALTRDEAEIHNNLMQMSVLAKEAIAHAMHCLAKQDAEEAVQVVESDKDLNALRREVESECLAVIAKHQPVASDLREVIGSLQIAGDIERIGDHAKDIAKIVLGMDPSDFSGPMADIARMGEMSITMLEHAMAAYDCKDCAAAKASAEEDRELDGLDQQTVSSLLMQLMTKPDTTMHATHLLWIAYHLERIGDRVANIAERTVFMVTAETPDL